MIARVPRLAAALLLAGCLAACGKNGAPTAPKDQPNVFPRAYPSNGTAPAKPADSDAFPTLNQPGNNLDPMQPRSTE